MTRKPREGQLIADREPSKEDRFEIERAIARDEEFQNWAAQQRKMQLATIFLEAHRYHTTHEDGFTAIHQEAPLDDYVESCLEDRAILFNGLGA